MNYYINFQSIIFEWGWIIITIIFILLEMVTLSLFFLFFAISSFVVSMVGLIINFNLKYELLLFFIISFFNIYILNKYSFKYIFLKNNGNSINDPMKNFIGDKVFLKTAIINGTGRIEIKGVHWIVNGPNIKKNTIVKIIGRINNEFIVDFI